MLKAAAVGVAGAILLAAAPQTPQFKSGVERILVDVQIVDGEGRPLSQLTAQDFEVRINRQLRPVVTAQFVRTAETESAAGGATGRGSDTTAPRADDPSPGGRDFIIAVDEASFRTIDAPAAIRAARRFVQRLAPNDRVGLFTFPVSPRYFALTPDHTAVAMAIDRVVGTYDMPHSRFHLSPSEVMDVEAGDGDLVRAVAQRECLPQPIYQNECIHAIPGDANVMVEAFESQSSASVYAMRTLFSALRQDPQRKTVILLSGGLMSSDRVGARPNIAGVIDMIGAEAARADATVYVLHMDSSFLQAFSASNAGRVSRSLMRESSALASGLERLAATAGGTLLHADPGAEDVAFQRILRETSAYYVLAVEPSDDDRDGRLHYISVKANARGAEVRARRTVIIPKM